MILLIFAGSALIIFGILVLMVQNMRLIKDYNSLHDEYLHLSRHTSDGNNDYMREPLSTSENCEKKMHILQSELQQVKLALEETSRSKENILEEHRKNEAEIKNALNMIINKKNNEIECLKTTIAQLNSRINIPDNMHAANNEEANKKHTEDLSHDIVNKTDSPKTILSDELNILLSMLDDTNEKPES
jgi:chromosome segregation ATPase